ncbi:HdeD family acid-resistance protein [Corynebacterium aquilae]|uniref:HdeD family acid-resistance protein n=1 Tax=Corynebacterium aquilae TaxID=203263 RepID=UPI0009528847|nr:DUF308 domain-containing protein [Corynebacterium aquilae]
MNSSPRTHHWIALLVGALYILTGVIIFFNPLWNMALMGVYLSLMITLGGFFDLWRYFAIPKRFRRATSLLLSVVTIVLGIVLLTSSFAEQVTLVPIFIAFWLIFAGAFRISMGVMIKKTARDAGKRVMWSGIGVVVLGVAMTVAPVFSAEVISYTIAFGFLTIGIAKVVDFFTGRSSINEFSWL